MKDDDKGYSNTIDITDIRTNDLEWGVEDAPDEQVVKPKKSVMGDVVNTVKGTFSLGKKNVAEIDESKGAQVASKKTDFDRPDAEEFAAIEKLEQQKPKDVRMNSNKTDILQENKDDFTFEAESQQQVEESVVTIEVENADNQTSEDKNFSADSLGFEEEFLTPPATEQKKPVEVESIPVNPKQEYVDIETAYEEQEAQSHKSFHEVENQATQIVPETNRETFADEPSVDDIFGDFDREIEEKMQERKPESETVIPEAVSDSAERIDTQEVNVEPRKSVDEGSNAKQQAELEPVQEQVLPAEIVQAEPEKTERENIVEEVAQKVEPDEEPQYESKDEEIGNLPARINQLPEQAFQDNTQSNSENALKTYVGDIATRASGVDLSDETQRVKGRMGDQMVEMGLITESQLHVALHEKSVSGKMLGEIMVELGFIDEETLTAFLARSSGYEVFDPKHTIFDGDTLALIEKDIAIKHKILPISVADKEVRVAMADPYDVVAMDTLRRFLPKNLKIIPLVSTGAVLNDAIDAAYGYASSVNAILKELEAMDGDEELDLTSLDDSEAFSHPIVRLVNALVFEAVKLGASDLHFEPEENFVRLRYRKDGTLFTAQILHKQHWSGISQRIKIMSNMNIADKLSPQDGRFGMNVNGREADFRVSSLPTVHGENIVLRVLDQSSSIMPMEKLGFSEHNLNLIKESQAKPEGIIIVTGPTGSGKTTSLYSMLNEINNVEVNIQTLEDPVEYSLPMIRQTHVREGVLEFADGIKALLRQDPDIIFIGEIRDGETAGMALKAAMTGHQVYTTLHTNDSFGAIPRLFDLGLKPGMVAGSIVSIFAQRLTRLLCPSCKEPYKPDTQECQIMGVDPANPPEIFRARQGGCDACGGQGYKGRTAVVEILKFDEEMDELLARGESKAEIKALAVKKGFKSMKDDGIIKVLEGKTSLEAIAKVVDIRR